MKPLQDIFKVIHAWPEEVRQLIAVVIVIGFAILIFGNWDTIIASRIEPLGTRSVTAVAITPRAPAPFVRNSSEVPQAPVSYERESAGVSLRSPLENIADSVRGFVGIVGNVDLSLLGEPFVAVWHTIRDFEFEGSMSRALDNFGAMLYRLTR
jgi:hypothetical protein